MTYSFGMVPQGCFVELESIYDIYKIENIRRIARSMFVLTYGSFKHSYLLLNLDDLKDKIIALESQGENKEPKQINMQLFNVHYLIDCINICTCFENYFKYKLLVKGYMINRVKNISIYKDLYTNKPILIDDILRINKIKEINSNNIPSAVSKNTLSLSEILNEKNDFNRVIKAPSEFFKYLTELNKFRNNLHHCSLIHADYSLNRIDVLKRMDKYLQSELDSEMIQELE